MKKLLLFIGVIMSIPAMLSANDINIVEGTVQDVEGNTYRTVKIGKQVWLAENLRSTKFQDGSKIKTAFIPDDNEQNLLKYGRLYDWHDVTDERNICPIGWRVASDGDWKELEKEADNFGFEQLAEHNYFASEEEQLHDGIAALMIYSLNLFLVKSPEDVKQNRHPNLDERLFNLIEKANIQIVREGMRRTVTGPNGSGMRLNALDVESAVQTANP